MANGLWKEKKNNIAKNRGRLQNVKNFLKGLSEKWVSFKATDTKKLILYFVWTLTNFQTDIL